MLYRSTTRRSPSCTFTPPVSDIVHVFPGSLRWAVPMPFSDISVSLPLSLLRCLMCRLQIYAYCHLSLHTSVGLAGLLQARKAAVAAASQQVDDAFANAFGSAAAMSMSHCHLCTSLVSACRLCYMASVPVYLPSFSATAVWHSSTSGKLTDSFFRVRLTFSLFDVGQVVTQTLLDWLTLLRLPRGLREKLQTTQMCSKIRCNQMQSAWLTLALRYRSTEVCSERWQHAHI
jgi:hypothetical protein